MKPKSKSAQDEERMLADQVRAADYFTAFLFAGQGDRRKVDNLPDYRAARDAADRLEAEAPGRKAIVYAVNRLGSFPVTPDVANLAGVA